jgi:hypothetical protein
MKLYNPRNGATFDTESDDELHNAVYLDMGWLEAPEPEPAPVGRVPEPVTYEPVTVTAKRRRGTSEPAKEATD